MKRGKRKPKAKRLVERTKLIDDAVIEAFKDTPAAHFNKLTECLLAHALEALSVMRRKTEDAEAIIIWSDEPVAQLYNAIGLYSEYTKTPINAVIETMIMRIGPNVDDEYRWN